MSETTENQEPMTASNMTVVEMTQTRTNQAASKTYIDYAILGEHGREVSVNIPGDEGSVNGTLIGYDGERVVLKSGFPGSELICVVFLNSGVTLAFPQK